VTATDSALTRTRTADPEAGTDTHPTPTSTTAEETPEETAEEPATAVEEPTGEDVETTSSATDSDDPEDPGEPPSADREGARIRRPVVLTVLAVLAVSLAGLTATQAVSYHRARVRAAAEASVLGPAKAAAARILSYDYRHIEQDATQAIAVLTGVFRGQYEAVMRQQIVPQAPKQHAVVQAEVLGAGVTSVSPDGAQAVVLIFVNQTVSNTSAPRPRVDQVRVRLTMDRVGAAWLVSEVDAL
jgi:Mce-associated membrane protein